MIAKRIVKSNCDICVVTLYRFTGFSFSIAHREDRVITETSHLWMSPVQVVLVFLEIFPGQQNEWSECIDFCIGEIARVERIVDTVIGIDVPDLCTPFLVCISVIIESKPSILSARILIEIRLIDSSECHLRLRSILGVHANTNLQLVDEVVLLEGGQERISISRIIWGQTDHSICSLQKVPGLIRVITNDEELKFI